MQVLVNGRATVSQIFISYLSLHFAPPNLATQISEAPWPLFSEMLNGDFRNGGKLDLEFKGLVVS